MGNVPEIEVIYRSGFGRKRFIPYNHDAKILALLLNQKTLTEENLSICRNAGWSVKVKTEIYKLGEDS